MSEQASKSGAGPDAKGSREPDVELERFVHHTALPPYPSIPRHR